MKCAPGDRCGTRSHAWDNGSLMTLPDTNFLDGLRTSLGSNAVVVDDHVVVRPADTIQVSDVVRRCASAGIAIVSQGGNTGRSGGTQLPTTRPAVVLSLTRMNTIESTDPARSTLTVQAGVTIEAIQHAAAAVGQKFAPDWGARGTATIGGAVATDAGGNNVLRYGNIRDNILGLEAVLADGQIWDGRRALRKDSSGYDVKQLLIGSEGTLAVVTGAVVKLVPATPFEQSALAALESLDALTPLFSLAQTIAPDELTAFELIPDVGIQRVSSLHGTSQPLTTSAPHNVLIKLASADPVDDRLTRLLAAAADAGHILDAVVAGTPAQEAALWTLREEQSPVLCYPEYEPAGLKLDTAVPIDRIAEFIEQVHVVAADLAPMALCYAFGHVGDGNIHMMVLPTTDDAVDDFLAVKSELTAAVDDLVFALDGTLSAEHGIGTLLRDRIAGQKPAVEWEMMQAMKDTFDPDDLFNPGKTLPPLTPT
jgi:FAD/FMN-containing dehydrogenase